jgi:hypothetical protein
MDDRGIPDAGLHGRDRVMDGPQHRRFDDDVMHELDVTTGRELEVVDTARLVNGP